MALGVACGIPRLRRHSHACTWNLCTRELADGCVRYQCYLLGSCLVIEHGALVIRVEQGHGYHHVLVRPGSFCQVVVLDGFGRRRNAVLETGNFAITAELDQSGQPPVVHMKYTSETTTCAMQGKQPMRGIPRFRGSASSAAESLTA